MKPRRAPMKRTPLAPGKPLQRGKGLQGTRGSLTRPNGPVKPRRPGKTPTPPEVRFARMVKRGPVPDGRPDLGPCLLYLGATNGNGYGQFRYKDGRRNGYAHRFAWEHANGPIPSGLTVDHLCRVRNCVEITHLELVDAVTNYRRGVAAREACPNGHPYTPNNTQRRRGGRACRTCRQAQEAKLAEKRRRPLGSPDPRVRYDQTLVRAEIAKVRRAEQTIAQAARWIGCNPNYLGRRIWNETKQDVFARDNQSCCRCSQSVHLDAHHRRPRGRGGTTRPDISFGMANLVSLCRPCHDEIESERESAKAVGWLVPNGVTPEEWPVLRATPDGPRWQQPGAGWTDAKPHPRQRELLGEAA